MFIKLNLTNGQTVSAFVDEATVEYLNEVIIEEGCYDDESEITDYDYVDYANLMSGEFVFIFDKKYDLEKDVESFEVDRYAMESEEDKEKRMAKYRTVSQDAMDYALDFFHGSISKVFENERDVNPDSLPILFTTEDDRSRTLPKFTFHGNEPAIYINLQETILSDSLKENIRHAVIQYILWRAGLPFLCSSAEFACMGYVYGVLPYKLIYDERLDFYKAFQHFYDNYLKSWNDCDFKQHMIGQAISAIHKCSILLAAYEEFLKILANQAKSMKHS